MLCKFYSFFIGHSFRFVVRTDSRSGRKNVFGDFSCKAVIYAIGFADAAVFFRVEINKLTFKVAVGMEFKLIVFHIGKYSHIENAALGVFYKESFRGIDCIIEFYGVIKSYFGFSRFFFRNKFDKTAADGKFDSIERFFVAADVFKNNHKVFVLFGKRFGGPCYIFCDIPLGAVIVIRGNFHSGWVKGFAGFIAHLIRVFGDFDIFNGGAHCKEVCAVVFEIKGAVLVNDGSADAVLGKFSGGFKNAVTNFIGFSVGGFFDCFKRFGHSGFIRKNAEFSGGIVIEEIDVNIAVGLFIIGCKGSGGLGVTLGRNGICNAPGRNIDYSDVVSGICGKLAFSGNADICSSVINCRGAGAHGNAIASVLEFDKTEISDIAGFGVIFRFVKISAFGGKIKLSSGLVDAASDVANVRHSDVVNDFSGVFVDGKKVCVSGLVTVFAVIGSYIEIIAFDISARPIKTAFLDMAPGSDFFFIGFFRVFIGDGKSNISRFAVFGIPESGVNVAVAVSDLGVGLTFERVAVKPYRFKSFGIESLNGAVVESDEDKSFRIGKRADCIGGRTAGHFSGLDYFAAYLIDFHNGFAGVAIEIIVNKNRNARCAVIVTCSDFVRPIKSGFFFYGRSGAVDYHVVIVVKSEERPAGIVFFKRGRRRFFKVHHNESITGGNIFRGFADISKGGYVIGIGFAFKKFKFSVFVCGDALLKFIADINKRVFRVYAESDFCSCKFCYFKVICFFKTFRVFCGNGDNIFAFGKRNNIIFASVIGNGIAFVIRDSGYCDFFFTGGSGIFGGVDLKFFVEGNCVSV